MLWSFWNDGPTRGRFLEHAAGRHHRRSGSKRGALAGDRQSHHQLPCHGDAVGELVCRSNSGSCRLMLRFEGDSHWSRMLRHAFCEADVDFLVEKHSSYSLLISCWSPSSLIKAPGVPPAESLDWLATCNLTLQRLSTLTGQKGGTNAQLEIFAADSPGPTSDYDSTGIEV